jgi:hypothetical protein
MEELILTDKQIGVLINILLECNVRLHYLENTGRKGIITFEQFEEVRKTIYEYANKRAERTIGK